MIEIRQFLLGVSGSERRGGVAGGGSRIVVTAHGAVDRRGVLSAGRVPVFWCCFVLVVSFAGFPGVSGAALENTVNRQPATDMEPLQDYSAMTGAFDAAADFDVAHARACPTGGITVDSLENNFTLFPVRLVGVSKRDIDATTRDVAALKHGIDTATLDVAAPANGIDAAAPDFAVPTHGIDAATFDVVTPAHGIDGATPDVVTPAHGIDTTAPDVAAAAHGIDAATHDFAAAAHGIDAATHDVAAPADGIDGATPDVVTPADGIDGATFDVAALKHGLDGATHDVAALKHGLDAAANNGLEAAAYEVKSVKTRI